MKRILLLVLAFTAAIGSLSAQNYIVVNSEKVFKSIDEYNKALDTLDHLAKSYQQQVDLKFEEVEALYNNYKAQEMSLSASSRQARQNLILTRQHRDFSMLDKCAHLRNLQKCAHFITISLPDAQPRTYALP